MGDTVTELSKGSTTGVIVALAVSVPPLYFAVMVAIADALTAEVCTFRLNAFSPLGTTTLAGTGNAALLLVNVTVAPPEGAAALNVTTRLALAPPITLVGETAMPVNVGSTTGAMTTLAVFTAPL